MSGFLGSVSERLRLTLLLVLAAVLVAATVVTVQLTGSGSDAERATESPGDDQTLAVAQRSTDQLLAEALTAERAPLPGDDFPAMPRACVTPGSSIPRSPCPITSFGPKRPTVVLWGDSHAQMYLPAVQRAATAARVNLMAIIAGGCPPAIPRQVSPGRYGGACEKHDVEALDYLRKLDRRGTDVRVVLSAFWSGYRLGYRRIQTGSAGSFSEYNRRMMRLQHTGTKPLFRELGRLGVRTDVVGQAATVLPVVAPCPGGREPYQCDIPRFRALYAEQDQRRWMTGLMRLLPRQARYIDPATRYCDAILCRPQVNGINTYYDDIHLGAAMTATMAAYFRPTMAAVTRRG